MTILVTGCGGAVAAGLITLLRERGLDVRPASSRPPDASATLCDLTAPATFAAALDGVTSVFLYAAREHADAFAKEAAAAGVEHVVLLSSSSVLSPSAADDPLADVHLTAERAVAAAPFRATSLRPGSFASNAKSWSWPLRAGRPIDLPYPGAYTDPIHEADIAEAALAVLTDPSLGGRPYHLTGPESLTFAEQAGILARATGLPVTVNTVTREAWKAAMAERMPSRYADGLLDWWRSRDGVPAEITGAVEELTGHPARTFATWAADHLTDFTDFTG